MSPFCCIRRQIDWLAAWWRGSVVRMKSSLETLSAACHVAEALRVAVGELDRRNAFGIGRLQHLDAVLVGAREEEHVLAVEPLEAREGIGRERLVGVPDMRHAVGIEDRRRDVERLRSSVARSRRACVAGRVFDRIEDRDQGLPGVEVVFLGVGKQGVGLVP